MINLTNFIVTLLFTLAGVLGLPDCLTTDLTCPLENYEFSFAPKPLPSWEKCRDLCNSYSNCSSFTFYGEHGSPFENMCFLFENHCKKSEMVDCKSCVSGYLCDYCSVANLAYSMNGENFITMLTSYNESHCRDICKKTINCSYYTIYTYENELMPSTCILLSGSAEPVSCEYCRTGPKTCNFSAECKSNEAVIMSSIPSTSAVISQNGTQKVETMGCSVKANILLIGGGGTGGYMYYNGYMYGGGGSGYINYTTVHIPFSTHFDILVGSGGVESSNSLNSYYVQKTGGKDASQTSMTGQNTTVVDEFGAVVSRAEGGEQGYQTAGGNGYSGGGSAGGQNGGMDGGDGGSSSNYKGGCGSGFKISKIQHLFKYYNLVAAKGNNGSTGTSSSSYGGGGGGIRLQPIKEQVDKKQGGGSKAKDASYSYGQGGDGENGKAAYGNDGVVLFEIKTATKSLIKT